MVESRGLPSARSPKGAMGLMQVMPAMLEPLGMAGNFTTVESNIEAGCLILADNIRRMGEGDGILGLLLGPEHPRRRLSRSRASCPGRGAPDPAFQLTRGARAD